MAERLIDAEAWAENIQKDFCDGCDNYGGVRCSCCKVEDILVALEEAPTIEAKPVVRAHWEEVREGRHICSNCKVKASLTSDEYDYMEDLSDYCPHCGAQMDELVSNTDKF